MTRLGTLRRQLATLRRTRKLVRWTTAYAALLVAVVWALGAVFALDVIFELSVLQRLVVMTLGATGAVVAFLVFTRPLLGVKESELDVALMVERRQEIDSDLVAALQFESPEAVKWGSPQLESAVVDYVAQLGRGLHVFEGFSIEQMVRRGLLLAITLVVAAAVVFAFPEHLRIFVSRLVLGGEHYPSDTVIDDVAINHNLVLSRSKHGTAAQDAVSPEGRPLNFAIKCSGELPADGSVQLVSTGAQAKRYVTIELTKLTDKERASRLRDAAEKVQAAIEDPQLDIAGQWTQDVVALIQLDAPQAVSPINTAAKQRGELARAKAALDEAIAKLDDQADETALYVGQLPRMVAALEYSVRIGDAWTDVAAIDMIPLPIVERRFTVTPPAYALAASGEDPSRDTGQYSVLEGSEVKVAIECTNGKQLTNAWVTAKTKDGTSRHALTKVEGSGNRWELAATDTPFHRVGTEIRYEIQVTDADKLHRESPLEGVIRIRPDRPPSGKARFVHRVWLPTASPVMEYTVTDDYGIARLALHVDVERMTIEGSEVESLERIDLPLDEPLLRSKLPHSGQFALNLSPMKLRKGDRVKVEMEVVDYQGDQPGQSVLADPLVLEISDESGVLAAISEADQRSEEKLTDIIKRQLGIGDSP